MNFVTIHNHKDLIESHILFYCALFDKIQPIRFLNHILKPKQKAQLINVRKQYAWKDWTSEIDEYSALLTAASYSVPAHNDHIYLRTVF